MKKFCILLVIICCNHVTIASTNTAYGNNIFNHKTTNENPLKKIVRKIAKANVFDATPVANKGKVISEQEINYRDLLNTASPEQLIDLATNYKNAVVRLYAFRALMEKVKSAPNNLYQKFKNDNTSIKVINGKFSERKPLSAVSNGFLY